MKVDFSQQLKNLVGIGYHENGTPITLAAIAGAALLASYPDERMLGGEEKYQRYELASKIHASAEVEVSDEDVTRLKTVIGKFYGTELVGPAYRALSPVFTEGSAAPTIPTDEIPTTPKKRGRKLTAVPTEE